MLKLYAVAIGGVVTVDETRVGELIVCVSINSEAGVIELLSSCPAAHIDDGHFFVGRCFGLHKIGNGQRGNDYDHGNYDQQFDQGKPRTLAATE